MIRFSVKENVTKYLEQLEDLSTNKTNKRNFLKDSAQEMHFDYIEPRMPRWNPNLMLSPVESKNQKIDISEDKSIMMLTYTGFTEEAIDGNLPKGVWSEFGDKYTKTLERDYAYYQETGEDEIADDFEGHHYVEFGTKAYLNQFYAKTQAYSDSLLNLEPWSKSWKVDLYDYMEYLE